MADGPVELRAANEVRARYHTAFGISISGGGAEPASLSTDASFAPLIYDLILEDGWIVLLELAPISQQIRLALRDRPGRPDAGTRQVQCDLLRDIFGNPFASQLPSVDWRSDAATGLARSIYAEGAFGLLPILADALEDAGCDHRDILNHCRGPGPHVRGCWVVDLVLGKEQSHDGSRMAGVR